MPGRSRSLLAILLAIIVASCGSRPGIAVSIAGTALETVLVSDMERTLCSGYIGDAFPRSIPLTTVRTALPVRLAVRSGDQVSEIRVVVYEDVDGRPAGDPIEEFTIAGSHGEHDVRTMRHGRAYNVLVNASWSFVVTGGSESDAFRVRIEPP